MHIAQPSAFAFHDNDRLALEPIAHLRERMPEVMMVEFGQRVHGDKVQSPKSKAQSLVT